MKLNWLLMFTRGAALAVAVLALLPGHAAAQSSDYAPGSHMTPYAPNTFLPSAIKDVGIDQKMGAQVPLDASFHDESGKDVKLADYFGKRPVILALVYYKCPMLCTMVLNDLLRSLKSIEPSAGQQFEVLAVSFDPHEGPELARTKKAEYVKEYNRAGGESGWHFLTGSQPSIAALTDSVGFRYRWDEASKQYAHASGVMILTPEGRTSKYIYGIDYAPEDLKSGVLLAGAEQVGPPTTEIVLMWCFHYDPATGRYGLIISRALKAGGILTLLALGSFMLVMFRRDRLAASLPGAIDSQRPKISGDVG